MYTIQRISEGGRKTGLELGSRAPSLSGAGCPCANDPGVRDAVVRWWNSHSASCPGVMPLAHGFHYEFYAKAFV